MEAWLLWIKALHVISVIAWMAGMLYLPRLYVYHTAAPAGSELHLALVTMERRLLRAIINPAMIATFAFGGLLLYLSWSAFVSQGWLHAKLLLVLALSALHGFFATSRRRFEEGRNRHSARFFKIVNESVTLAMIAIVILVIVKPF
jgi:putative membrane protein